jgi:topoisomerase IA-like protein
MKRPGAEQKQPHTQDQDIKGAEENASGNLCRFGPYTRESVHPPGWTISNPGAESKSSDVALQNSAVSDLKEHEAQSRASGAAPSFAKEIALLRAYLGPMIDTILFTEDTL